MFLALVLIEMASRDPFLEPPLPCRDSYLDVLAKPKPPSMNQEESSSAPSVAAAPPLTAVAPEPLIELLLTLVVSSPSDLWRIRSDPDQPLPPPPLPGDNPTMQVDVSPHPVMTTTTAIGALGSNGGLGHDFGGKLVPEVAAALAQGGAFRLLRDLLQDLPGGSRITSSSSPSNQQPQPPSYAETLCTQITVRILSLKTPPSGTLTFGF